LFVLKVVSSRRLRRSSSETQCREQHCELLDLGHDATD